MEGRPPGRIALAAIAPHLAYAALALWLFSGPILEGHVLFFRDLSTFFYPNYVFLERSLAQGVWPLWNPGADAGAPFLPNAYPLDLLLVSAFGAGRALALVPPLHLLIALSGIFFLGRRLGMDAWGAWTAGISFGIGGYFLSCVNLLPLLQAGALAPWVLDAALALFDRPTGRRAAALAALTALQVSTLAGEIVVLTWLAVPFLVVKAPTRKGVLALGGAALLAALLLAPVLGNVGSALAGTQRAAGFDTAQALGYSARIPVLLEALLPRFFGDVHAFTYHGFWGQAFFPEGNPYFLSLYLGPVVLVAALAAGRHRAWLLVLLGVVLSLGEYGPLAPVLPPLLRVFRSPVKFFFLCALGLSVLAGTGVTKRMKTARPGLGLTVVGATLALGGALLLLHPGVAGPLLAALPAEFQDSGALWAAQEVWPGRFLLSGLLALAAALALGRGPRLVPFVPAVLALDLLIVNGGINTSARRDFYELRAPMKSLVQTAQREGLYRWFSYGVANATRLTWAPEILRRNADVWLYYLDRQALLPRTHVLDGLEGAFDVDRTGLAPRGSVLEVGEASAPRFSSIVARLRLANVRWVLSFDPLPEELVARRAEVAFPEVSPPLTLFELRDPLPRAFWVGRAEVLTDSRAREERLLDPGFPAREAVLLDAPPPGVGESGGDARGSVAFESIDAHHVRLRTSGAPGFAVVLSGYHPGWKAAGPDGPLPLLRADGRYWAVPTRGGDQVIDVRFAPPWVGPALGLLALGALASVALALRAGGEV